MRRNCLLLISVVFLTLSLLGCTEGSAPVQPAPSEVTLLRWWGAVPEENGPAQVVEKFNAIDPLLQVEYVFYNNDDAGNNQLDIKLLSAKEADVFASYNNAALSRRIESGAAAPLKALMESAGISIEEMYGPEAILYIGNGNGDYYHLPAIRNQNCILYNQTMFDEAGIPRPTPGWTYEEFEAAARALTTDEVYGYYYPPFDGGQPVTEFVQTSLGGDWMYRDGGNAINFDHPLLARSFELYERRVAEGLEPDYVTNKTQKMTAQDMLLQGKAAMVFGSWLTRYVKNTEQFPHDFVVGYATIPKLDAQQDLHVTSLTEYMSVSSKSKHPFAALNFIRWYITEGIDPMIENGKIPAYQHYDPEKVIQLMFGGSMELFDVEEAKKVLLTPEASSDRHIFRAAVKINEILSEEFVKSFAGEQSAEEAITRAQVRAEQALRLLP